MRRPFLLNALVLFATTLLLPVGAAAQTGAASLTGIVTDQSGAAVPGATVTATSQTTNVTYTATSNASGNYNITSLPVGTYVLKAELAGFKTAATKPIDVEAKQILRMDFKLELGALEETVQVIGQSPVLQTETATVGDVISGTTLNSLPLNGRNTGQLSLLLPGVVTPNPSTFTGVRNTGGGGRPYVNGNREQTNNYTFDGVDMNESIDNLVAYQPSPDSLAEISVETNNYAADIGNVAGRSSVTSPSRARIISARMGSSSTEQRWTRTPNNRSSAPKPERRQDIWGNPSAARSQNKLFFGDYQGTRFNAPGSETRSVAPDAGAAATFEYHRRNPRPADGAGLRRQPNPGRDPPRT
jgi:hypothetical protein